MARALPALSCNAHCHVFGPGHRFAYALGRTPPAGDAPKESLFALNDRLGLERSVVVQSAVHGMDNSAAEDAISERPKNYRGVALLPIDVPDAELSRLNDCGFRGVRFNYMTHLGGHVPATDVLRLADRLVPLGWHLQIHGDPDPVLTDIVPALLKGPVPVVIDHIGRIDAALGLDHPHAATMMRLMERQSCWVKVSGIDRITSEGPPYRDALPFACRLVSHFTDRVVWGTDWPHPNHQGPTPDDEQLVDLIHEMAPEPAALQALMVNNPARLYGFGTTP